MSTVKVEYVGNKPQRADTVAGTGLVWVGKGDVKEVPADKWALLRRHPDIWKEAGTKTAEPAKEITKPMLPAPLATMEDPAIHVLAKERGYKLHAALAGENLRKKFAEAEAADDRVKRGE